MYLSIDKGMLKSLLVIADIIEARDPYTGGHVWRVSHIAKNLALKAGLSNDEAMYASIGAYIHDLGKVGIPDAILNKTDKLTDGEFETIKTHPIIGANLLNEHPLSELAYDVVIHHHERLDGKGYPHHLDGDTLSISAKIVALSDAFDALTSSRPYRKVMKIDDAINLLTKDSGSHFDPSLISALQALSHSPELAHIVGHSDEGIPLINCPACGSIFSISRETGDGDSVYCRVCTGKHIMHRSGNTFTPEFTGTTGTPQDLQPKPDLNVITDFVLKIPKALKVEQNTHKKLSFFQKLILRTK